jgi:hypothetical protein
LLGYGGQCLLERSKDRERLIFGESVGERDYFLTDFELHALFFIFRPVRPFEFAAFLDFELRIRYQPRTSLRRLILVAFTSTVSIPKKLKRNLTTFHTNARSRKTPSADQILA